MKHVELRGWTKDIDTAKAALTLWPLTWTLKRRGGGGRGSQEAKREQQDASSHTLSMLFGCVDIVDMAELDFFPTVDVMNVEY